MKGLIFTCALIYGGAVTSLLRPFYGFLIYVTFATLRPKVLWFYSVPRGNYSRIVAVAFLLGWLLHGAGSWAFGKASAVVMFADVLHHTDDPEVLLREAQRVVRQAI